MKFSPWRGLLLLASLLQLGSRAQSFDNITKPIASTYFSRPDILAPAMNVSFQDPDRVEPGYVFIAPYQTSQPGPYIYDKTGNLIWSGHAEVGPYNAHNFHVCQYQGSDHLCMFQGNQLMGYARGQYLIMNKDYEIVKTVASGGDVAAGDQHEFRLVNDGESALITVYNPVPYDLTRINLKSQGWVMDSVFQEVNVSSGEVMFEWSSVQHIDPYTSYVYPDSSDVAGDGLAPTSPWDFFHMNTVVKSAVTGNYIISARHLGTIFNINATDGSIIWRLEAGGFSDFECINFNFSFQHDVEIRQENNTHMTLSFYDNASNLANHTSTASGGKVVTIDFEQRTASLVSPITAWPSWTILSASQGNSQHLLNGNVFNCYGDWPVFAEFAPDGSPVWGAQIGVTNGKVMVYRAYSSPWHSIPAGTKPSLWTYAKDSDKAIAMYVSWNGCTEVAHWNFYGANDMNEQFELLGSTNKRGFETMYTADTHYAFTFVEAIGYDGSILEKSSMTPTFVPSTDIASKCDDTHCSTDREEESRLSRHA